MKRETLYRAVLIASVIVAGAVAPAAAQTPAAQAPAARSLPMFEVDPAWPKIPAKWKVGDASSFAVDAQDNVWLLHRPRTLKPEQAAMAAPPVMVFDPAGNNIKAWGGSGQRLRMARARARHPYRLQGLRVDRRQQLPRPTACPGLKPVADDQLLKFTQDGKFVMQIGHSNQSKGNADTANLHRPADVWVHQQSNELYVADGYGNHRVIVFDADTGAFKRMWGAFGNKPMDDDHCEIVSPKSFPDAQGPANFSIVHAIRVANATAPSTWRTARTGACRCSCRTAPS